MNKIFVTILALLFATAGVMASDSIPSGFSRPLAWRVVADVTAGCVPGTNGFVRGENPLDKRIGSYMSANVRADFSFDPSTRQGMLYRGLYQGIGLGVNSFFAGDLLGTPVSAYVYQGAPIVRFNSRLWLGYEWQFGAAMGWKHNADESINNNSPVSTSVTAYMGLDVKLHYQLADRWQMSLGVGARHFSNGNTSWPNPGVNAIVASVGLAYTINPFATGDGHPADAALAAEADHHEWFYDIMVYGAWRKRVVRVGDYDPQLCPGRFGVLGLQFSPMYRLNRWVLVGPALDMQWDESAGLAPYWIDGTSGSFIKFFRPPVGRQLSAGLSAHAELTMPIFSVNAGLGYDFVTPRGDKRFYQSLTLKTFVSRNVYINTGYRLGDFKDPQNLMLGIGVRL
ncbi:MAG: acyloxyacyl hydrolase [Muribaculaceae bacterium]|nr:acyloxyacyl hydrolase [Muribaculaceae bacterium]